MAEYYSRVSSVGTGGATVESFYCEECFSALEQEVEDGERSVETLPDGPYETSELDPGTECCRCRLELRPEEDEEEDYVAPTVGVSHVDLTDGQFGVPYNGDQQAIMLRRMVGRCWYCNGDHAVDSTPRLVALPTRRTGPNRLEMVLRCSCQHCGATWSETYAMLGMYVGQRGEPSRRVPFGLEGRPGDNHQTQAPPRGAADQEALW